jgi:hypothetical protein
VTARLDRKMGDNDGEVGAGEEGIRHRGWERMGGNPIAGSRFRSRERKCICIFQIVKPGLWFEQGCG